MRHSKEERDAMAAEAIKLIGYSKDLNEIANFDRVRISAKYGDNGSPIRYRVSGGICEHWPNEEKEKVRELVKMSNDFVDRSFDLWKKAGRRSHTWREIYHSCISTFQILTLKTQTP